MQLIPAIDLIEGRVVRLLKGDFAARTRYAAEPVALAGQYRDMGAHRLHVVDLDAARGSGSNRDTVATLAALPGLEVQCAGGIRDAEQVAALLDAGAARVVIGSLAVRDPERVSRWLGIFGSDRIVLALDVVVNDGKPPELLTHGWQQASGVALWPLLARYAEAGLKHLLCTDINCDGTLAGPNMMLYRKIRERYPAVDLQASGGVGSLADIDVLKQAGLPGVILGRALLEGRFTFADALARAA